MNINWKLVATLALVLSLSIAVWSSTPPQALAHVQTDSESQTVVSLQAQGAASAQAEAQSQTLRPTHDATVNITSPDTPNNGGNLGVQGQNVGGNCDSSLETYLQIDLSSLSGSINSASLTLQSHFMSSGNMTMSLFGSTNDAWNETDITWNSKPAVDSRTSLATATITPVGSDVLFSNSAALLAFLESERSGDGVATLGIVSTACDSASITQSMLSKEGTVAPQLELTTAAAPDTSPSSISLASFDGQTATPWRQAGLLLLVSLMAGVGLLGTRLGGDRETRL